MKVSTLIAKRYLFAKKSYNLINVISIISFLGVFICSAALIIILSVFNGFEGLQLKLFNSFDPTLKVVPTQGKFFKYSNDIAFKLKSMGVLKHITPVIEENVFVRYKDKQHICTIKGVDSSYVLWSDINQFILSGSNAIQFKANAAELVVGNSIASQLNLAVNDILNPLTLYVPKPGKNIELNPEDNFNKLNIFAANVFAIQPEIDAKYMLCDIATVQNFFNMPNSVSALELSLKKNVDEVETQQQVQQLLGTSFKIQNRYQQHELLYKIMRSEKWIIFFILFFILIMASFNLVGSLTMLVLDKKKDITTLNHLGANKALIQRIFVTEGLLISVGGALAGLALGSIFCLLQQYVGLIKIGAADDFIIQYYPIQLKPIDFLYVFCSILVIAYFAAIWPVKAVLRNI